MRNLSCPCPKVIHLRWMTHKGLANCHCLVVRSRICSGLMLTLAIRMILIYHSSSLSPCLPSDWTEIHWLLVEATSEDGGQIQSDSFLFGTRRDSERAWREAYAFTRREKFALLDIKKKTVAFIKILQKKCREGPHIDVFVPQVGQTRLFFLLTFASELCQVVALMGKSLNLKGG